MLRKIIALSTIITASAAAGAIVLDPAAVCAMHHRAAAASPQPYSTPSYTPMIIDISDESAIDELTALGCIIYHRRDNLLLTSVPYEALSQLQETAGSITRAEMGRTACAAMDMARPATAVEAMYQTAEAAGIAADGSGVIVGLSDMGFDPHFIEFGDRVKQVSHYEAEEGQCTIVSGADLDSWVTDNSNERHATHVCGIMAGAAGYSPYYGIAGGADIIATTSELTEVGILAGVEDIIAYAKAAGQPAVVNLSLADYIGPHDGSDLFCQYLDKCADDAMIVLAAGNNGSRQISLRHSADEATPSVTVSIENNAWDAFTIDGYLDIWSADSTPVEVQLLIYDTVDKKYVYSSQWFGSEPGTSMTVDADDSDFAQYLRGSVVAASALSPYNDRHNIMMQISTKCPVTNPDSYTGRYLVGVTARTAPGNDIYLYTDGQYTWLRNPGIAGVTAGNSSHSISNMACSHRTISVGNYGTRNSAPIAMGGTQTWTNVVNEPLPSSSPGTILDGRSLPHICAPGAYIVAPLSGPYATYSTAATVTANHKVTVGDNTYYWTSMAGTSMASPHVAGIAACWLSIDPTLTPEQIRDIAIATATPPTTADSRWGAGLINALAGAESLLPTAVSDVSISDTPSATTYYDLHGNQRPAESLSRGIYIARNGNMTKKIVVR